MRLKSIILVLTIILGSIFSSCQAQIWLSQNDSRWRCTQIGNCTGYFLGYNSGVSGPCASFTHALGCAVTSATMIYGNSAFTPDLMNAYLTNHSGFNTNCEIYWSNLPPGVTTVSIATKNDWANLYSNIMAGKKAIVNVTFPGSTGSDTFRHWVLVYAFSGGSTTSAGNYKVYDPWPTSSTTYTTLASYTGFKNAKYCTISMGSFTTAAPTGLTGSCGLISTTENIGWPLNSNATGYEISIKKATESSWTAYTSVTNSYSFTGLSLGTTYNVRLRAFRCTTYSSYSATYTFSTPAHRSSEPSSGDLANEQSELTIYPNPSFSTSPFTISFGKKINGNVSVSLYKITGEVYESKIYSVNGSSLEIAPPQSSGLYLIKISTDDGQIQNRKLEVL